MADEAKQPEQTFGEKAVRLSFNVGVGPIQQRIHEAKTIQAKAADMMNDLKTDGVDGEHKALYQIAVRKIQEASMAMVAAVTYTA